VCVRAPLITCGCYLFVVDAQFRKALGLAQDAAFTKFAKMATMGAQAAIDSYSAQLQKEIDAESERFLEFNSLVRSYFESVSSVPKLTCVCRCI